MSPDDLDRIERELAISLPRAYRAALSPFPVPACRGNSDRDLWDDAEELIAWNRSLRAGSVGAPPWPTRMFSVGTAGASSCYAIDLDAERAPVWWVDQWRFDAKGTGIVSSSFEAWLEEYVRDLRNDCVADGIAPDEDHS